MRCITQQACWVLHKQNIAPLCQVKLLCVHQRVSTGYTVHL